MITYRDLSKGTSMMFLFVSMLFFNQLLFGYDNALVDYYSPLNSNESVAQKVDGNEVYGYALEALGDLGVVSFFDSEGANDFLGLFVLEGSSEKYQSATLHRIGENIQVDPTLSSQKKKALIKKFAETDTFKEGSKHHYAEKLDVLDLYDSHVLTGELWKLELFKNAKIMGLPRHGIHFDETFVLPSSIQTLVVRNSILNTHFFNALSELDGLDTLIFIDCHLDSHVPFAWSNADSADWLVSFADPFGFKLIKKVGCLRIIGGSSTLVTNILASPWPKLKNLEIYDLEQQQLIRLLPFFNRLDSLVKEGNESSNQRIARLFPLLKSFSYDAKD